MSKTTDLSSLQQSISTSVKEYSNIPMPDDASKLQAIQILAREVKLVSDEEKRIFDQEMQESRFELEKDRVYSAQNLELKKFEEEKAHNASELDLKKEEQEIARKRLRLESKKQNTLIEIEKERVEIEKLRLEQEKTNSLLTEKARKDDQKFKYISLGLSIGIPALTTLISLLVYRRLAYSNLKLIYADEGRPTVDFKDAVKCVKNLTR